ncbi:transthyretin-like family protein [Blastopirellula sp. JC732]|uniref:Transthyretin-like family protein n=1 Tax=Blastopirellula sediminis TaxID=2894196 RepID=A0A9X1MI20_9BACT|nr:transthyretin-like family protein [Blastopirellula sediminis]MCC9607883.1 transthyretin-like family protein [Blastopirellula sediminis]MCC9627324.1 transthyretin-like family protein [Blastopirellula sediminis]
MTKNELPLIRGWISGVLCVAALLCSGCSQEVETARIRGRVSLNGAPREGVEVTFWNEGQTDQFLFSTATSADGTFEVQNIALGDVRQCVVTFSKPALKNGKDLPTDVKSSEIDAIDLAPAILRDPKKSPVKTTVPIDDFQYDITSGKS